MGVAPVPVYAQETKEKTLAKVLAFALAWPRSNLRKLKDTLTPAKSCAAHESTLREMACTLTIWFMFTTLSCEHFGLLTMLRFDFFAVLKFSKPQNTGSPSSL